jgi:hypothetical protein
MLLPVHQEQDHDELPDEADRNASQERARPGRRPVKPVRQPGRHHPSEGGHRQRGRRPDAEDGLVYCESGRAAEGGLSRTVVMDRGEVWEVEPFMIGPFVR